MSESRSLMEIVSITSNIETMLIEANGEITEEIENLLAIKDVQLPQKVDSYSLITDRFEKIEEYYKIKAAEFIAISKAAGKVQDRLKDGLKHAMQEMGINELKGFDYRFKLSATNPKVVIDDETQIEDSYCAFIKKPESKRIAEDLKLGIPVKGARLEQSYSLRKYLNRGDK